MPTYDYACKPCGHKFEQFQSITAAPLKKCPKCGKNGVQRLIGTGAGLIFKGSGFYITDYRSEGYKSAAKADSGSGDTAKTETKTSTETKAESKPAKTESKPAKKARKD